MDKHQYRLKVNDAIGPILDQPPFKQWSDIAKTVEARGGVAILERRLITDSGILILLTDPTGFIKIKDTVICPWEVLAAVVAS